MDRNGRANPYNGSQSLQNHLSYFYLFVSANLELQFAFGLMGQKLAWCIKIKIELLKFCNFKDQPEIVLKLAI